MSFNSITREDIARTDTRKGMYIIKSLRDGLPLNDLMMYVPLRTVNIPRVDVKDDVYMTAFLIPI